MNKVFLIGNLTRDSEYTEMESGLQICRFTLAVKRNYRNSGGEFVTDFFDCIAWRGLAESLYRNAHKGNKLAVSGTIELVNYTDSKGEKRMRINIVVQEVEYLTPRFTGNSESNGTSKKPALQSFDDDGDIPF